MTRSIAIVGLAMAASLPTPTLAQMMPGMKMDHPMPPKPRSKSKAVPSKPPYSSPFPPKVEVRTHRAPDAAHAAVMTTRSEPGPRPSTGKEKESDAAPVAPQPTITPDPHVARSMAAMPGMAMDATPAPYGEGSGTSRSPGNDGTMHGLHLASGDWMAMLHGYVWDVYTDQGGPRGSNEAFVESMAMLSAERDFGGVRLQLRSMLSLEPAIGARGYPNVFATGETADGTTQLVDRQHPHDLFMELSARLDVDTGAGSIFFYGGPVAEPALGPSAFMHRASARYLPLSPITHHWFDSTHISYGVVTAGYTTPYLQLEASAFRGREPDQHRWGIERPSLDSWSVRGTWTPSPAWALQVSHGRLRSPEQLEPARDEARTTASVQYARGGVSALIGYALKDLSPGRKLSAWLAEANWDIDRHHSVFARGESVANDELFADAAAPLHDLKIRVGRLETGYAYRLPVGPTTLALGGTAAVYAKPRALDAAYGRFPVSFSIFAKLSLGH